MANGERGESDLVRLGVADRVVERSGGLFLEV